MRHKTAIQERFEKHFIPVPFSGCWIWTGFVNDRGYGYFLVEKGKSRRAHNVAYKLYKGSIPDGLESDHLCRVRCCVNPDHIEYVTHKVNMERRPGGWKVRNPKIPKIVCKHGHLLDAANRYRDSCIECQRQRSKKWRQQKQDSKQLSR